MEGKIFDIYSPRKASVDQIIEGIEKKVAQRQTQRVIINMRNQSVNESQLVEALEKTAIPGLEEAILFNRGTFSYPRLAR